MGEKTIETKEKRGKEILKVKEKEMWKGTNKNDRNKKGQVVTSYSSESIRQIQESSAPCRSDQHGAVSNYGKTRKNGRVCDNKPSFTLPNTKPSIEFTHPTSSGNVNTAGKYEKRDENWAIQAESTPSICKDDRGKRRSTNERLLDPRCQSER